jgi:hypothetical protein
MKWAFVMKRSVLMTSTFLAYTPTPVVTPYVLAMMDSLRPDASCLTGGRSYRRLDDTALAAYARTATFHTVVSNITFGTNGEWSTPRGLQSSLGASSIMRSCNSATGPGRSSCHLPPSPRVSLSFPIRAPYEALSLVPDCRRVRPRAPAPSRRLRDRAVTTAPRAAISSPPIYKRR